MTTTPRPYVPTSSERYLARIAQRSFLTLWSYPHVFRDQGINSDGVGKEVADLLVVFEDDLLLFSDRACAFPNTGNLELDWARWYRRTIKKAAEQLWGAERWIRTQPDRLFVDRGCQKRLPIALPPRDRARFHRIVVANDETGLRRRHIGGSGTLFLRPEVVGDQHATSPFVVGDLDPTQGFVHVLDETSLRIVLGTLDTVSDLVAYLRRKEALIRSGRLGTAAGEEDLLGWYLRDVNADDEHDFVCPPGTARVGVPEGHWRHYLDSPERAAKEAADRVSYAWDMIIEKFTHHSATGTLELNPGGGDLSGHERVYRVLARENRTRRRMLADALLTKVHDPGGDGGIGFRVIMPSGPGDPYYVFVIVARRPEWTDAEYRERRRTILLAYSKVAKLRFRAARMIIGLATEPASDPGRSEDVLRYDCSEWTADDEREARFIQEKTGWLKSPKMTHVIEQEYPVAGQKREAPRPGRNDPCFCGSGLKFKKCCGQFI